MLIQRVTIDVEPDLIEQARVNLAAAGYAGVNVVCGDGADGVSGHAPYDRIIVTAGAWDLSPQWLSQLRPDGQIVLPISVRGIQLAVAFWQSGDHWVSKSACRCQFIRMTGALAGPESLLPLGPQPGLHAYSVNGPVPDADLLYEALSGPATELSAGFRAGSVPEVADFDLWLTLTQRGDFGIVVQGYGAAGASLAEYLAGQAAVWDRLGRPGADSLELAAYPAGTPVKAPGGSVIIDTAHIRLLAGWPATYQTSSARPAPRLPRGARDHTVVRPQWRRGAEERCGIRR